MRKRHVTGMWTELPPPSAAISSGQKAKLCPVLHVGCFTWQRPSREAAAAGIDQDDPHHLARQP